MIARADSRSSAARLDDQEKRAPTPARLPLCAKGRCLQGHNVAPARDEQRASLLTLAPPPLFSRSSHVGDESARDRIGHKAVAPERPSRWGSAGTSTHRRRRSFASMRERSTSSGECRFCAAARASLDSSPSMKSSTGFLAATAALAPGVGQSSCPTEGVTMSSPLDLNAAGRRRSPATLPGYHAGRAPCNKGLRCPAEGIAK